MTEVEQLLLNSLPISRYELWLRDDIPDDQFDQAIRNLKKLGLIKEIRRTLVSTSDPSLHLARTKK